MRAVAAVRAARRAAFKTYRKFSHRARWTAGGPGWAWTRLDLDSSYRQILAVRLYVWSRMEASSTANLRQQAVADWDERLGWLKSNMPLPVFQAVDRIEMRSSGCGRPICFLQEQDIGAPQGSGLPNQCNAIIGSANTEQ